MSDEKQDLDLNKDTIPPVRIPKPRLVNGVPVSFPTAEAEYEDDKPEIPVFNDPISRAIESDISASPPKQAIGEPPPFKPVEEEPKIDPTPPAPPKTVKTLSGVNAINLFKQAVGAGLIPVRIYSTDQEVLMRELTVTDQKTLSKTALINNNRRDIMYAAQNSLINSCVKNKGFDIRELTEFDRVVCLLRLYQQNYFTNDIKYTCPKCGKENVYKMDFGAMLNKVKDAWRGERTYVLNHGDKEFHFTIAWPKVSMISQFYNSYYKQYQKANEKTQNTIDQLSNVEYLVMFIRRIELFLPDTTEGVSLNLDDYIYDQRTDIIDSLPQGLVFDDNDGIISKVIADFTDPLNKSFRYENCQFCGAETEEGIGSIADFI